MIKKKNLIIGAATGYKKKDLFNFVESLRSVFFEDVILIMNKTIDMETNHYLNSKNIKIFFTDSTSRTIFKDRYLIYLDIIKYNYNLNKIELIYVIRVLTVLLIVHVMLLYTPTEFCIKKYL